MSEQAEHLDRCSCGQQPLPVGVLALYAHGLHRPAPYACLRRVDLEQLEVEQ